MISLYLYSSLPRRKDRPALVMRKWRLREGNHLLEITQVTRGSAKDRSLVRASAVPIVPQQRGHRAQGTSG